VLALIFCEARSYARENKIEIGVGKTETEEKERLLDQVPGQRRNERSMRL
jgi:hypothetical protein